MQREYPTADTFSELTFNKFNSLPKTGKPTKSEWTVLSSIIQVDHTNGISTVVSLGAGTKCIGKSKLCPLGLILNDSHAEVLARRGFMRYIYHQLKNGSDVYTYDDTAHVFRIKESISFHFFSTQVPCGDACIILSADNKQYEIPNKRPKLESDDSEAGDVLIPTKVYTGAKIIGELSSDPMRQINGALRTKPGRGDRTCSMSCSDKLSKWNILGVQGALLDSLLEKPIYFESLNFSCDFDMKAMNRAIYERWGDREFRRTRFMPQMPLIRSAMLIKFEFGQEGSKNPSPNGLVWCDVPDDDGPYEISVNGKKQGITKKALFTKKSSLRISKIKLLQEFCDVLRDNDHLKSKFNLEDKDLETKTYLEFKEISKQYQESWKILKKHYFQQWTIKPNDLLNFSISSSNKQS